MDFIKYIDGAFIAPTAQVMGDVRLGEGASIWYGAVVRGDETPIIIGKDSNIQDNSVVHSNPGSRMEIGDRVTIGHGCIVHGCTIGDETLIGMGAVVLDGAVIGRNCLVAAGSVVTGKTNAPDGSMLVGNPAKVKRMLTPEEKEMIRAMAAHYTKGARQHFAEQ